MLAFTISGIVEHNQILLPRLIIKAHMDQMSLLFLAFSSVAVKTGHCQEILAIKDTL